MKTKQEQIEEMAQYMCNIDDENYNCKNCLVNSPCIYLQCAEKTCNQGYRKAAEVIDELVKNIMTDAEPFLSNMSRNLIRMCASKMKKEISYEMRQEVEK